MKDTIFSLAMLLLIFVVALPSASGAEPAQSPEKVNEQTLIGRWVRPDGGYILEVKEIAGDGTLKAAYFNPRPINVAQAEISRKGGEVSLFIELRDINYPGSTYNLRYDPKADRLTGSYFQAVTRETYNIEFFRVK